MRHTILLVTALLALGAPRPACADEIPAGTRLQIRLHQLVSSFGSKPDTRVSALLIAPVESNGRILLPLGTEVLGHVEEVRRVGLGLSREVARVHMTFDVLRLPGGQVVVIDSRVAHLDDARESVDEKGWIHGIRATASFASMLSGMAVSVGFIDPMLLGFTAASSLSVFRIPESEIILPAGTELKIELLQPLELTTDHGPIAPSLAPSPAEREALERTIRALPFRTATEGTDTPSDLTNLAFLGTRDAVARAFDAAGWYQTDALTAGSTYATMRAIVENQGYREAPMSTLLLDGAPPRFTYAKTLNTFFSRHHLRIFGELGAHDGLPVWTSSSTHDSGIGFATRAKSFIHVIDEVIDEERDKVVHDLILTGCVEALEYLERPWIPKDATNATGDSLVTDGRIAVLRLNDCGSPVRADAELPGPDPVRPKPSRTARIFRDIALTFKNDAFRGNPIYQGYWGLRLGFGAMFSRDDPAGDLARSFTIGGQEFMVVPGAVAHKHEADLERAAGHRASFQPADSPRTGFDTQLEFAFSGGYSRFGNDEFSRQDFDVYIPVEGVGTVQAVVTGPSELRPSWALGPNVTLNTNRFISHEFGYTFNNTTFAATLSNPLIEPTELTAPAQIRQFSYNVLVHFRPNGKRIRPYALVGPAFQLIRLDEATQSTNELVKFAFKEVGLLLGTWDFGSKPPLEGGGIFQVGLQYGAGLKMYITPHTLVRLDFVETLSEQPDFWTPSHPSMSEWEFEDGITVEPRPVILYGPLRHQRFSLGFGVAF